MAEDADPRRCKGTNRAGDRCAAAPLKGSDWCRAHDPALPSDAQFGSPDQADADRAAGGRGTRRPRVIESLREHVEAEAEAILAVYVEARYADRGLVVGSGEDATLELVPDHPTRVRATDSLLDRVLGRPRQAHEHSGPDGGDIPAAHRIDLDIADPAVRDLIDRALAAHSEAEDGPE